MIASLAATVLLAGCGLKPGASFAPFEPWHVTGPYQRTNQCPVCEYTMLPMVFVWTDPDDAAIPATGATLQAKVDQYGKANIKTFILDLNRSGDDKKSRAKLGAMAKTWKFPQVWLLSRPTKLKAVLKDHALTPWTEYKSITYLVRNRKVQTSFVNLTSSSADQSKLNAAIDLLMK